jgi:hypothetical protein
MAVLRTTVSLASSMLMGGLWKQRRKAIWKLEEVEIGLIGLFL